VLFGILLIKRYKMNKNLVKWVIIFGGGLLGFSLFKPKKKDLEAAKIATPTSTVESFDDNEQLIKPTKENAEIVAKAYTAAMQAGEPSSALAELNKECMKDYAMRCYVDKNNKLVVCDVSGSVILSK
jgi:dTDP-4-dehydrorhamnose reductase